MSEVRRQRYTSSNVYSLLRAGGGGPAVGGGARFQAPPARAKIDSDDDRAISRWRRQSQDQVRRAKTTVGEPTPSAPLSSAAPLPRQIQADRFDGIGPESLK